ncbi:MAG TPA: hypothetical protein VFU72_15925, partial [Nitrolancea sp.]|nr:hypothetical protein [Nitrolancea sp.]
MNSRKLFSLMAALALLALAPLAGFPPAAQASTTVTVCPLFCAYSQIQPAIDAASNGVTIVIAAGTFSGGIIVNKNVTLQGAGATATTISGGDPVVNVDAGVTASIDGVTITGHNSDAGWG